MSNLLSGLEALGLGNLSNAKVFDDIKEEKKASTPEERPLVRSLEEDFLFEKTYKCPCCDNEFKELTVKTGKAKPVKADSDLRPYFEGIDPLKYETVVCPSCGYAALNKFFGMITTPQMKLIKENISKTFTNFKKRNTKISYNEALTRYQLVLANAIVKRSKISERAYICLKTAWLLRGKRKNIPTELENKDEVYRQLQADEYGYIEMACNGFIESFTKESFPMCGMDEHTVMYLVADLCRQLGRKEEAGRWVSQIITSRTAPERIKNKAREIKELLGEEAD